MTIPMVDLKAQYQTIREDIDEAIARVVASTGFIMGPDVRAFEAEFAAFCGAAHAVGLSSGTDAVHLALRAVGVKPGDEVITTPYTFTATGEAIVMAGATPVFVDIDPRTFNVDPAQVEAKITPRTRALLPVHVYGQPADMDPLLDLAKRHRLAVVEDAAQAHGATYRGRTVGTLGDVACFSFFPGKNLGAYGDAGGITTNDPGIADRVRLMRDHGRRDKYEHLELGFGNRLDSIQAAILRAKLPHLPAWNERRRAIAAEYTRRLSGRVETPFVPDWANPVWHLYVIRMANREAARVRLTAAGIQCGVHYPVPLHLQPAYASFGYRRGDLPNAEAASGEVLSLPMHPEMTDDAVDRVVTTLMQE